MYTRGRQATATTREKVRHETHAGTRATGHAVFKFQWCSKTCIIYIYYVVYAGTTLSLVTRRATQAVALGFSSI